MDAHGDAVSKAGASQLPAGVELIEGVAALVDHGIQGGGHLIGEIVGGDADVVTGEVDGEGVLRLADDAVVSVDVHDIHDEVGELALDRHG